jgi:FimV-like protein
VRRILILAASIFAIVPADSSAEWLTLRTPHHQVAGNVPARHLKDVGLRLEQFRDVIATLNPDTVRASEGASIVVLAFPDERSYRPFMPMAKGRRVPVDGLFVGGPRGIYITLNLDAAEGAYRGIYHEYSHFLLRYVFGSAPLWFNEGLAEYYSTLDVSSDGRRAVMGKPIERHVLLLRERRLPLAQLLSITAASPIYASDTPDRSVLYAQSWALVHHALHGQPRRPEALTSLAFKLAAGATPEQAVRDAYGMSLADLEREVQAYMRRETYQATGLEFKTPVTTTLKGNPVSADEGEVEAWLGGVQMSIGRPEEGAVRLDKALKTRPDVVAAMSRSSYQVVVPGRAGVLAGMRLFMSKGEYAAVRGALTPMVKANPADHQAALMLAEALLHLDDPDGARALLGPVLAGTTVESQKAQARTLLAQVAVQKDGLANPPTPAASAPASATAASTPEQSKPPPLRNQGLVLALRQLQPGEQRALGTLQTIVCARASVAIVVRTREGEKSATAANLAAVNFVTFRSQTAGDITCGAQAGEPALLTWRQDGSRTVAVSLELLPDGYVP